MSVLFINLWHCLYYLLTSDIVFIIYKPLIVHPSPAGNPNSGGATASPAGQASDDLYMEKLKSLQKYIEPLRRMIKKTEDGKIKASQ